MPCSGARATARAYVCRTPPCHATENAQGFGSGPVFWKFGATGAALVRVPRQPIREERQLVVHRRMPRGAGVELSAQRVPRRTQVRERPSRDARTRQRAEALALLQRAVGVEGADHAVHVGVADTGTQLAERRLARRLVGGRVRIGESRLAVRPSR